MRLVCLRWNLFQRATAFAGGTRVLVPTADGLSSSPQGHRATGGRKLRYGTGPSGTCTAPVTRAALLGERAHQSPKTPFGRAVSCPFTGLRTRVAAQRWLARLRPASDRGNCRWSALPYLWTATSPMIRPHLWAWHYGRTVAPRAHRLEGDRSETPTGRGVHHDPRSRIGSGRPPTSA